MPGGYVHLRRASLARWLATFHHLPSALDIRRRLHPLILLQLLQIQEYPPVQLLQLPHRVREDALNPVGPLRPALWLKFPLGISLSMLPSLNPLPLPLIIDLFSLPSPLLSRLPHQWTQITLPLPLHPLHISTVLSCMNTRTSRSSNQHQSKLVARFPVADVESRPREPHECDLSV